MMRRVLRFGLYVIGALLILLIGAVAFLQTGPGKRLIAAQLTSQLSTEDAGFVISDIEGWIPIDMRVGGLALSDEDGVWLKVDGISLDWSPSALIGGRIQVDTIEAARIELVRLPPGEETAAVESDEPFRLPELPTSLPPLVVERLAVPEILLGPTVLGEPATFGLEGSIRANENGDSAQASLDLKRTDQPTAAASLEATADLDQSALDLAFDVSESGGLIGSLTGQPDLGDVTLSLQGQGPLDDWQGQLRADADGLGLVETELALALVDQPRLTLDGSVRPVPGFLPEEIAGLVGEKLSVDLDVVQTRAQALDLRNVGIEVDIATLNAEGTADFDSGDLALSARIDAPDLSPLGKPAGVSLAGGMQADLNASGTLDAPAGKLDLRLDDPAFDGKGAKIVRTTIGWASTAPLSSETPAFNITVGGDAEEISIPDVTLPDPNIAWSAKLEAPLEGAITIERLLVETAGSSLTADGEIDPAKLEGAINLALDAPSLKRLAEPYGQPVDGKALINMAVQLADQAQSIDLDLDASLDDLAGLPPGAAELLGSQTAIKASAMLDPSRMLTLENLAIDGAHLDLGSRGSLDLDQQDVTADITVDLPDLSVLEPLVPEGTQGAVAFEADIGGSLDAPTAELRVRTDDLSLADEPIAVLDARLAGKELTAAPEGDLQIDITARETPATLATSYRLSDGILNLDGIALRAPETEVTGNLAITLDGPLVEGSLSGGIADLGALSSLIQQQLAGAVDLRATLLPEGERQDATITLQGRDLGGDFGSLKTLDAEASLADIMAVPKIDTKSSLTGFKQGTTEIDALTLSARGDQTALDVNLDVAGNVLKPLELGTAASIAFDEGVAVTVDRLDGAFAAEPLRLAKPLRIRQAGDSIQLADLDLRLGSAALIGDIDIGETSANGKIELRALPLRWSEVFDGPELDGIANADIDLSGSTSEPTIVASLTVEDVLAADVVAVDAPLDVALRAQLDQGRLDTDLELTRLTRNPITATASLPARLQLSPFAFDMPNDGKLEGSVNAELLLDRLGDLLASEGQTMSGTLLADLTVGGTLEEPTVSGPLVLEDAVIENAATATRIHSLNMRAVASSERIDVESFTGRTGRTGRLEADGWLALDAESEFPLSVTLRLDKAELVDRDDLDGRISGEIAMTGNLADPRINGDLTVNRLEVAIPEGGGPTLPEIDVEEVGGRFVNPPEEETDEDTEARPFDPTLDIRIQLPNKIYVRGRGLESEWTGDLNISGQTSNPVIVGDLSIKKGYFDFLDKRFELSLGEISFSGATPPNPIIALEARAEDDDFTAIIKLNGPADDPQLLLESEPALPQDEILARLLFNRELSEIGPVEAGKLALAVNRLRSSGGGFDAFGEIRGILRIDTLDVVSDDEGESLVRAGKYLNDDVYVEVEQGASEESGRARVEIELHPNIALEAEASENADSGVGIKWKLDY